MTNDTKADANALVDALRPANDGIALAIELIRTFASKGDSLSYVANALNLAGIPTITGRGRWYPQNVKRLAEREGIKVQFGRAA
jgi:hypothetical protein